MTGSYHFKQFAIMITQKVIIQTLRDGGSYTKNPNDHHLIIKEFQGLNNGRNYTWMFKKTEEFWNDKDWRVVAKDVQEAVAHYKSK